MRSLLFVNDLALVDLKNNVKVKEVSQMSGHILRIVPEDMPLTDLLEEFKRVSHSSSNPSGEANAMLLSLASPLYFINSLLNEK